MPPFLAYFIIPIDVGRRLGCFSIRLNLDDFRLTMDHCSSGDKNFLSRSQKLYYQGIEYINAYTSLLYNFIRVNT